jgi:hypothetical protein
MTMTSIFSIGGRSWAISLSARGARIRITLNPSRSWLSILGAFINNNRRAAARAILVLRVRVSLRAAPDSLRRTSTARVTVPPHQGVDPADVEAIGNLLGGEVRITESHVGTLAPPADFFPLLDRKSGQPESIAVIAVRSYHARSQYRRRMSDWLWRALAAAWIVDHVVLLLPSPSHLQEYRNALMQIEAMTTARAEQDAVRLPSVHVLAVEAGPPPHNQKPPETERTRDEYSLA